MRIERQHSLLVTVERSDRLNTAQAEAARLNCPNTYRRGQSLAASAELQRVRQGFGLRSGYAKLNKQYGETRSEFTAGAFVADVYAEYLSHVRLLRPSLQSKSNERRTDMHKSYSITVYVDGGPKAAYERIQAAGHALRGSTSGSVLLGQNGHVFVDLTDGRVNTCMGFYGNTPSHDGPIRIEPSLVKRGWSIKKTYSISEQGYHAAFHIAERWNTDGQHWARTHNCGDFAEAIVRSAGVNLIGLQSGWAGHRPGL